MFHDSNFTCRSASCGFNHANLLFTAAISLYSRVILQACWLLMYALFLSNSNVISNVLGIISFSFLRHPWIHILAGWFWGPRRGLRVNISPPQPASLASCQELRGFCIHVSKESKKKDTTVTWSELLNQFAIKSRVKEQKKRESCNFRTCEHVSVREE